MRVVILGAGGVGGYLGARLITGGADVTFLTRDARAAALKAAGLVVKSPLGDFAAPVKVIPAGTALANPPDAVVLACKEPALAEALDAVAPLLGAANATAAAAQRRAPPRHAGGALPRHDAARRHHPRRRRPAPRRRHRAPVVVHDGDHRAGCHAERSRRGRVRRQVEEPPASTPTRRTRSARTCGTSSCFSPHSPASPA